MSPCPSPSLQQIPLLSQAPTILLLQSEGSAGSGPLPPHSDHAQGSPEMQSLSPSPALGGHQTPLPK